MEQRRTFRWNRISDPDLQPIVREAITMRLLEVLKSWEGTPYMRGQRKKGVAADCVNFVSGLFDELYRCSPLPVIKMPIDVGIHSRRERWIANKTITRAYPHKVLRGQDVSIEPGDLLVVRRGQGPGHVLIAGPEKNTLWHTLPKSFVTKTGIGQIGHVMQAWRLLEKEKWLAR